MKTIAKLLSEVICEEQEREVPAPISEAALARFQTSLKEADSHLKWKRHLAALLQLISPENWSLERSLAATPGASPATEKTVTWLIVDNTPKPVTIDVDDVRFADGEVAIHMSLSNDEKLQEHLYRVSLVMTDREPHSFAQESIAPGASQWLRFAWDADPSVAENWLACPPNERLSKLPFRLVLEPTN